jgi:exopolysaccharide biosynthesis polyprenyl glycosylphosphotransferase
MTFAKVAPAQPTSRSRPRLDPVDRQRALPWLLILSDALTALFAALAAIAVHLSGSDQAGLDGAPTILATLAVAPLWMLGMWQCGAYNRSLLPMDTDLYRRIVRIAVRLAALLAIGSLVVDSTRLLRHTVLAVALAVILTPFSRRTARWAAGQVSEQHTAPRRGLIVGHPQAIADFVAHLLPADAKRLKIAAACVVDPLESLTGPELPIPVLGDVDDDVVGMALAVDCDVVIVLSCAELDGGRMRRLCWRLHEAGVDVALAPILTDMASGRIAMATTGGLPLLHIKAPILSGPARWAKSLVERAAAVLILLLLSPLMLGLAATVRATSPGPALFRQRRVGLGGEEFTCLKFRTMVADAEARRAELEHLNEMRDGPLFKISKDPRLTRVGAVLRRYSLDELPQLFNVVGGSMSLVGPRPPLPAEVARYGEDMRRRLAVKPGLTGLWQVSGRSSLSWADSVRLDLSYVENWSPGLDAMILLRTTSAVVRGTGT